MRNVYLINVGFGVAGTDRQLCQNSADDQGTLWHQPRRGRRCKRVRQPPAKRAPYRRTRQNRTPYLGENFTYKRPYGFILGETAYKGLKTWKTLYLLVLNMLQAADPAKFAALPETERFISNRGKPLVSANEHNLRIGEKLDSGLYAEINLSANALLKYIKELLEHFGLDPRTMKIYLREDRDADKVE